MPRARIPQLIVAEPAGVPRLAPPPQSFAPLQGVRSIGQAAEALGRAVEETFGESEKDRRLREARRRAQRTIVETMLSTGEERVLSEATDLTDEELLREDATERVLSNATARYNDLISDVAERAGKNVAEEIEATREIFLEAFRINTKAQLDNLQEQAARRIGLNRTRELTINGMEAATAEDHAAFMTEIAESVGSLEPFFDNQRQFDRFLLEKQRVATEGFLNKALSDQDQRLRVADAILRGVYDEFLVSSRRTGSATKIAAFRDQAIGAVRQHVNDFYSLREMKTLATKDNGASIKDEVELRMGDIRSRIARFQSEREMISRALSNEEMKQIEASMIASIDEAEESLSVLAIGESLMTGEREFFGSEQEIEALDLVARNRIIERPNIDPRIKANSLAMVMSNTGILTPSMKTFFSNASFRDRDTAVTLFRSLRELEKLDPQLFSENTLTGVKGQLLASLDNFTRNKLAIAQTAVELGIPFDAEPNEQGIRPTNAFDLVAQIEDEEELAERREAFAVESLLETDGEFLDIVQSNMDIDLEQVPQAFFEDVSDLAVLLSSDPQFNKGSITKQHVVKAALFQAKTRWGSTRSIPFGEVKELGVMFDVGERVGDDPVFMKFPPEQVWGVGPKTARRIIMKSIEGANISDDRLKGGIRLTPVFDQQRNDMVYMVRPLPTEENPIPDHIMTNDEDPRVLIIDRSIPEAEMKRIRLGETLRTPEMRKQFRFATPDAIADSIFRAKRDLSQRVHLTDEQILEMRLPGLNTPGPIEKSDVITETQAESIMSFLNAQEPDEPEVPPGPDKVLPIDQLDMTITFRGRTMTIDEAIDFAARQSQVNDLSRAIREEILDLIRQDLPVRGE